jgi:hypothetical protein
VFQVKNPWTSVRTDAREGQSHNIPGWVCMSYIQAYRRHVLSNVECLPFRVAIAHAGRHAHGLIGCRTEGSVSG